MDDDSICEVFKSLDKEIWLITARAGDRQSGLIATFVSQASLVPSLPRVAIGLAKHHFTHELIEASNAFCMHLIDEDHIDWVWQFGTSSGRNVDKLRGLIAHSTITANSASRGGGVFQPNSSSNFPITIAGTILAGNTAGSSRDACRIYLMSGATLTAAAFWAGNCFRPNPH